MVEMSSSQQQYLTAKFEDFIATVHPGEAGQPARKPYQWQIRLMLYVVEHGRWPQSIGAPTASGKTSVIDIHVFLNAMAGIASVAGSEDAQELGGLPLQRIPRRLVLTVNRRSLVDDQFEEADMLRDRLQSDDHSDDGLRLYRRGLDLRSAVDDGLAQENKSLRMITAELRGGISPNREWRYYPQTCAVICATPDMFGSRLLFRGYGTSRTMRSMEAGLLAYDTVLIADEAHLSRQLLETACQVSRIENMAETPLSSQVTPLQVVETTATPASGNAEERVGVLESDFEVDTVLARRLNNPKSVFTNFDFEKDKDVIDAIVAQCIALILSNIEADKSNDSNPHVLGCIVNTVKNAKVVAKELERQCKKHGINRPVDVYIGPMRAFDKCQIARKLHSLPYLKPDDAPCCIIGTQTLEVGVDVNFTDMVTEIAPGSALVQRSGRVNRRGLRSEGSVYVFGLDLQKLTEKKQASAPRTYSPDDIRKTWEWLASLPKTNSEKPDISAWSVYRSALNGQPIPGEQPRRLLFQRLEPWDVENLSSTDEDLCADISEEYLQQGRSDLNLWLRDNLELDTPDINVVVRHLPWDDALAIELLEVTQPENDELFPVGRWRGFNYLFDKMNKRSDKVEIPVAIDDEGIERKYSVRLPHRVFRYRASEPENHRVVCLHEGTTNTVRSGDVLILDDFARVFSKFSEDIAIFDPEGSDTSEDIFNQCDSSTLVTSYDSLNSGEPKVAEAFRRLQELEEGDFVNIDEKTERMQEDLRLLRMKAAGASFLAERTRGEAYSLVWYRREKPDVPYEDNKGRVIPHDVQWLVSSAQSDSLDSESNQEILSTRTTNRTLHLGGVPSGMGEPQRSDGHQNHVAQRAQALGSLIGLDPAIVEDLRIAGNFHDEGKKDERFQRMLRYGHQSSADAEPLAKSLFQSRSWEQRFRNTYQLRGWRHEQRSVAEFRFACETYIQLESMDEFDKQLVQRLIGTSHGHGRSTFHYGTAYLLPQAGGASRDANPKLNDISDRLFEMGEWETLVDRTSQRYGFWGISYLEALLRAADITCSKEGQ